MDLVEMRSVDEVHDLLCRYRQDMLDGKPVQIGHDLLHDATLYVQRAKMVDDLLAKAAGLENQIADLERRLRDAKDRELAHAGMVTGSRDMVHALAEGLASGFKR